MDVIFCYQPSTWWQAGAPREWYLVECSVFSVVSKLDIQQWWLEVYVAEAINK